MTHSPYMHCCTPRPFFVKCAAALNCIASARSVTDSTQDAQRALALGFATTRTGRFPGRYRVMIHPTLLFQRHLSVRFASRITPPPLYTYHRPRPFAEPMASAIWRAGLPNRASAADISTQLRRAVLPSHLLSRPLPISCRSSSSAQTFHHLDVSSTPHVPFAPPVPRHSVAPNAHVPIIPHVTSAVVEGSKDGAKKRERKQKYLDSLMEKAGELSLKCEWRLASTGCAGR